MDLVAEQLRAHNISYTKTLFSTKDGVMALGDRLFVSSQTLNLPISFLYLINYSGTSLFQL